MYGRGEVETETVTEREGGEAEQGGGKSEKKREGGREGLDGFARRPSPLAGTACPDLAGKEGGGRRGGSSRMSASGFSSRVAGEIQNPV